MRVFVLTSDKYIGAIRPFAFLFNRYWSEHQPVVVAGYSPPGFSLPPNFRFISVGKQADYPIDKWSDGLIRLLNSIDDSHIVLMLEDYWISRPVNTEAVRMLYDYARQFRYVLKVDLCGDRLYAQGADLDYGVCGYLDLVKSDPASQYHLSLLTGIWNRELLLRFLIRGETPWQVELEGTPRVRAAAGEVIVLGTRQWPVKHILAHRRGDPSELLLDGLKREDVEAMAKLGYFQLLEGG